MCYWKQWRYPRTKVRNLVRLGVNLDLAIKHAISRKKLLADVTYTCHTHCDVEQVAGATRTSFVKATLGRACSSSRNRLVRTRMLGGVGRAVSNGRPYPISSKPLARRGLFYAMIADEELGA